MGLKLFVNTIINSFLLNMKNTNVSAEPYLQLMVHIEKAGLFLV